MLAVMDAEQQNQQHSGSMEMPCSLLSVQTMAAMLFRCLYAGRREAGHKVGVF